MKKRHTISDEERVIFRENVKNVTPLKKQRRLPLPPPPQLAMNKRQPIDSPREILEICPIGHDYTHTPLYAEDALYFIRPGLQTRMIQRLRRGEITLEAELDLHGLTVIEAHQTLFQFLNMALTEGLRCVRIIHGKSGRTEYVAPILKNRVNYWLRQYPCVLGFCSATPGDGGKGAVYVLLKRVS
jgi:DNA-nicking Smr family endonuclease